MQLTKIVGILVGIVGFVAAVFGIIRGFREYRPLVPKLEAALVNAEHISSRTEVPDVKISLAFKDQSVSDLWLCRVRFQNVGGITLYTTGSRPNTQSPLLISVPEKYEILKIEPKGIDPIDSGFESQIRQKRNDKDVADKHQFEVTFEQWRKGEAIEAVLYLAGSGENLERPRLIPKGRPILDGDVVPVDLSTISAPEIRGGSTLLARLTSPGWGLILRLFGGLTLGFTLILFIVAEIVDRPSFGFPLFQNWRRDHPFLGAILTLIVFFGLYMALLAI